MYQRRFLDNRNLNAIIIPYTAMTGTIKYIFAQERFLLLGVV